MSENDPIEFGSRSRSTTSQQSAPQKKPVFFDRRELNTILNLYGRMVAAGEWRDYAIGQTADEVIFSVFRHTSEMALFRIIKAPKEARRQGTFRVVAASGMIIKRGHDLAQVLKVLQKRKLEIILS